MVALVLGVIGYIDIDAPSAGVGLLLVSIAFFIAAAALKRYRALSAAGTVFLILSGILMFDRDTDPTSIPAVVIGGLVLGGFMMFVIERAGKARSRPVMTGWEELIGMTGEVRSGTQPDRPGLHRRRTLAGRAFARGSAAGRPVGDSDPGRVGRRPDPRRQPFRAR